MKKFLVVLLALAFVGALAYADGSTVSMGFGRVQFNVASGDSSSGSQIMSGWANPSGDTWPPMPRENLDLAYSNNFTSFQLTAYMGPGNGVAPLVLNNATIMQFMNVNGTLKLIPDMLSLKIGEFNGDGWDTFRKTSPHPLRDVNNSNVGRFNGWGVILDVAPKDSGFEAAVYYQTNDPTVGSSIATLNSTIGNTEAAASYTLPNLLKVTAGTVVGNLYNVGATGYDRNIFGRVELLMVPNLTLWADARYDGFDLVPTTVSNINAELAAGYTMDKLSIAFAGTFQSLSGPSTSAWGVVPEVYYNLGPATAGVYVNVGGSSVANSGISYQFEPYVKLNDFNLRLSFHYIGSTATGAISRWEIPIVIDWGF
jgi:hypothetical protein